MDQQKQVAKHFKVLVKAQASRADKSTAEIVRKGITLQQIHGTDYAAQFMREKNVDIEVIMRVLLNLSTKRRYDDIPVMTSERSPGRRN